jgi:choice-of-anchor B domain-containing protein
MLKRQWIFFILILSHQLSGQLNMSLIGQYEYAFNTNDVWGYVSDDGEEYALVGTRRGLSIVALDNDPIEEVAFLDGSTSTWRDIKTWGDFAYVSTEAADGLMVADLSKLPNEVPFYFWKPEFENPEQPGQFETLRTIHNLFIDEFGILHITGSNINNGGVIFVDVNARPGEPKVIGRGPGVYSHDSYGRDSILYSSEIYRGALGIYDYRDLSNITLIGIQETPLKFTHNAWLSDNGNTIFTTDERNRAPVTAYDISNLGDIKELDRYIPAGSISDGATPHNVHVWNDWLIISYYSDGGKIVDASRPDNLVEVGNFDTFLDGDAGFGAWGAYPFLPSGKILITDSGNGLYVLEPNYVRAAFLEGSVKNRSDATGGGGLSGIINAQISIIDDEITLPGASKAGGIFKMGKAIPGKYEVEITADGFLPWRDSVLFENGVVTRLDVILDPLYTSTTNDPSLLENLNIFPNPVFSVINIDIQNLDKEITEVTIIDLTGKIIHQTEQIQQNELIQIRANQWPPGLYFVQLRAKDGSQVSHQVVVK